MIQWLTVHLRKKFKFSKTSDPILQNAGFYISMKESQPLPQVHARHFSTPTFTPLDTHALIII